jgi:hypothetical protein
MVTAQQGDKVGSFRHPEVDGDCAVPRTVDNFRKVVAQVPEVGHHFLAYQA